MVPFKTTSLNVSADTVIGNGLTVTGDISASNVIYALSGNSNLWNSIYTSYQETSGSFFNLTNTTFSELTSLKANNQLTPGKYYRISDFQLMWRNQSINDNTVKMGLSAEPLIVLALSGNRISHEAKSELYPQDTVYYDIDATSSYSWGDINNDTAIPNFKGWIYRRIDHKLNIDIPWDWRHITVNCCRPDLTCIFEQGTGTTYNLYSVVKSSNKLYYSVQNNNINKSLTNTDWWLPVSNFTEGNTYFVTSEYYGFRAYKNDETLISLPAVTGTRIQQPTFTSSLISQGTFELINCHNIKIEGGYSNVFLGNSVHSNTIGNSFNSNTIGNSFNSNTIGNSFNSNTIGNMFYSNTIENGFSDNIIRNEFYDNIIGNSFSSNTIGTIFASNTIKNGISENTIGNNFLLNTIRNVVNGNTIRNYFSNNVIGNNIIENVIGNYFSENTIEYNFNFNTIGDNFRKNTIESSNNIGDVTGATHVYNNYNTRIFSNSTATTRLGYFNASDQLVVTDPTA
jgi:hypothetical protein